MPVEPLESADSRFKSNYSHTLQDRFEGLADRLESRPVVILLGLTTIYLISLIIPGFLILWHDELFTYYIAKAGSLQQLVNEIRLLDLNPPLVYVVTGLAQRLLGESPFATRVPEILTFFLASIAFLCFVARRAGFLWGACAVLLLWYSPSFYYATQARPYALLLASFSLTLLSWDESIRLNSSYRRLALAGVVIGNLGMMASHVFGIFSIGPFLLAEMVRFYQTRKPDWSLWACLLLPLGMVTTYVPLMNRFQAESFPEQFQGGVKKIGSFYLKFVTLSILPGLIAAVIVTLTVTPRLKAKPAGTPYTRPTLAC